MSPGRCGACGELAPARALCGACPVTIGACCMSRDGMCPACDQAEADTIDHDAPVRGLPPRRF